jgi:hypothetical protein
LREAVAFVAGGNPLLIAIDVLRGKQISIPVNEHWQFGMAGGPLRLAMRSGSDLIPCSIVDLGAWHFQIRLGPPVPAPVLASGNLLLAGRHLLDAMLPVLREYPEQCSDCLLKRFERLDSKNKSPHEAIPTRQLVTG